MRILILCSILIVVLGIAHLLGGVAVMDADELAAMCAAKVLAGLGEQGLELPRNAFLDTVLSRFFLPGAYLVSRFGIDPSAMVGMSIAFIVGWWLWLTAFRLCWSIVGKSCGLINIGGYRRWLWFAIPWRPVYRQMVRVGHWYRQFRFGTQATAAWTGVLSTMTLIFRPGDCVFIGMLWWKGFNLNQPLGIKGPRHVTVIAASGAGKTRWLMGWLGMLHDKGSAFVIDCDGQMVNSLGAPLERKGHIIYNLDPYHLSHFPCASWNALDEISRAVSRHGRKAAVRFAQTLAEALIRETNSHQPIFCESARAFMLGLILYVWLMEDDDRRNLVRVRELLTRGLHEHVLDPRQDPFEVLLSFMEQTVGYDDGCEGMISAVIARAASIMRSGKTREGNPFRSNAITATAWLDIPEIAAISQRSDFAGEDLKTGNPCVFLVLPVTDIQSKLAPWARALCLMSMYAFQNIPGHLKIPSAFLIDEAPAVQLEILATAAPVFRKYGIRLVMIAQDIERLEEAYPKSWEGFIGNAEVTLWMSSDHQKTLEYLSKILGNCTIIEELVDSQTDRSARMDRREQPLMLPDQLRLFLDPMRRQNIVTRTGKPALRVGFAGYDKALSVFDYDPDRNFREPILRWVTRSAVTWLLPPPKPRGAPSRQKS